MSSGGFPAGRPPEASDGTWIRSAARGGLALLALAFAAGCHIDIIRYRQNAPLPRAEYEELEVQKSTKEEALHTLGAPDKLEWKNGKDYFWYLHADDLDAGIRFQFPPFRSLFGYQHTFLRFNEESEEVNAISLVFDEEGVLQQKSLRLSRAFEDGTDGPPEWKLHVVAHAGHSVLLLGDGGVRDYDELFENGFQAGVRLGIQPVPVFTIHAGATYAEFQGDSLTVGSGRLSVDDLHLYQLELGIRLGAPLRLLWTFPDFAEVKRVLWSTDTERAKGFRIFVEGTTGITLNGNVPVKIDSVRQGNLYDDGIGFSGTVGVGIEYDWRWGNAYAKVSYDSVDAFNEGSSPLDDRGGAFQAVFVGGGLSLKF